MVVVTNIHLLRAYYYDNLFQGSTRKIHVYIKILTLFFSISQESSTTGPQSLRFIGVLGGERCQRLLVVSSVPLVPSAPHLHSAQMSFGHFTGVSFVLNSLINSLRGRILLPKPLAFLIASNLGPSHHPLSHAQFFLNGIYNSAGGCKFSQDISQ